MIADKNDVKQRTLWLAILATATIGGSIIFACAMPFAALAALAAIFLPKRDGLILILGTFAANQCIGYGVLDYPRTWDSFAWGAVIGVSALLALFAGWGVQRLVSSFWVAAAATFAASFAVYELALYVPTFFLPSGDVFTTSIISYVLVVNLLGFIGLWALQEAGRKVGLAAAAAPI